MIMKVLVLTQENGRLCTQAKELLNRLSGEYGFSVSMLNVGSPEGQAPAMRGGMLFPPGIFLDGEPFSYSRPSERKLWRELERRRKPIDEGGAHSRLYD